MKEVIGTFNSNNMEDFSEIVSIFEKNGYEIAVQVEQGKIIQALILKDNKEIKTNE